MVTRRIACARQFPIVGAAIAIAAIAGCATDPQLPSDPGPAPRAPAAEAAPPPVNLQGFPPAYRAGFTDGCATGRGAERKDAGRFGVDGNYRVGWQDGVAQCKRK
jgi:hypothetical protein